MFCESCGVFIHNNACGCDDVDHTNSNVELDYWNNIKIARERALADVNRRIELLKSNKNEDSL